MQLHDSLPRLQTVERFRAALAARGATGLEVITTHKSSGVDCDECYREAAQSLGYEIRPERPFEGEAAGLARYEHVFGYTPGPREPRGPGTDRLQFGEPDRFGLDRLARVDGGGALWLWIVDEKTGHDRSEIALIAAPARAAAEAFLARAHELHVHHERRLPGLIVLGRSRRCDDEPVPWEKVLLPRRLREEIDRTVREFFASAELYRKHGLPHRRGILLAGPPGNGKTTILRALRSSAAVPVVVAALDDCRREVPLRMAFSRAAGLAPSILCFEDLDALVPDGPMLSQFLNLLDGLEPLEGVLVVATTNRPDSIDPAIAKRPSRFDRVFVLGPPDRALRQIYLERELAGSAPAAALVEIAARSEGMSVAFLKELVLQARLSAVRRGDESVGASDLEGALERTREHMTLASRALEARPAVVGFGAGRHERSERSGGFDDA